MKILIAGSLPDGFDRDLYAQVCNEIADQLVARGHELVLGSDREDTADYFVFERLRERRAATKVCIFYHEQRSPPFSGRPSTASISYEHVDGGWGAGRVPQVAAADAVITIGGQAKTELLILIARYLRKAVLPIPASGGVSTSQWRETRSILANDPKLSRLIPSAETWGAQSAPAVLDLAVRLRKLIARGWLAEIAFLYVAAILSVLFWLATFALGLHAPQYSVYLLCFFACTIGVCIPLLSQHIGGEEAVPLSKTALVLRPAAAVVISFVLFLTYLLSGYVVNGDLRFFEALAEEGSFRRVALVISAIGVSAGAIIDRALRAVGDRGISLGG